MKLESTYLTFSSFFFHAGGNMRLFELFLKLPTSCLWGLVLKGIKKDRKSESVTTHKKVFWESSWAASTVVWHIPTHSNRSNVGASGGAWTSKSLEMGTFLSKWHQQPLFPWPSISNTAWQLWERREGYNSHFCQFAYLWSPSSPPPPRSSSSHSSLACFHTVFENCYKCRIIFDFCFCCWT